jgi:hypothetical protein
VLNTISSVYPPTKEIANELTNSIEKALDKFETYEDLTMIMKRYRDILYARKQNLPFESEITGEGEKEKEREKEKSTSRDKKKKRSREREKRRDESSRTPDIKKRSPNEDYKDYKPKKPKK